MCRFEVFLMGNLTLTNSCDDFQQLSAPNSTSVNTQYTKLYILHRGTNANSCHCLTAWYV